MGYVDIAAGVHRRLDEGQQVDPEAVGELLSQPSTQAWAEASLPPRTVLADLDLRLAGRVAGTGSSSFLLAAQQDAVPESLRRGVSVGPPLYAMAFLLTVGAAAE